MILKLALLDAWSKRGTVALQLLGLAIVVMAMRGGAILSLSTRSGFVPGSNCSEEILQISGVDSSGGTQVGWTPRQTKALLAALDGTLHAEVMPSTVTVATDSGNRQVGAAFVGPRFFELVCVSRINAAGQNIAGPIPSDGVVDERLQVQLGAEQSLQVEGRALRPTEFSRDFEGLQHQSQPESAWFPSSIRWDRGSQFLDFDVNVVTVLIRASAGASVPQIVERVERAMVNQPTLFKGLKGARAEPSLQLDSWTAGKVRIVAILLQLFSFGLFVLLLVNILTYQFSRLPGSHALATTLSTCGVPPRAMWIYAAAEPIAVAFGALLLGLHLSIPTTRLALSAATNSADSLSIQGTTDADAIVVGAVLFLALCIVGLRGWFLTTAKAPAKGRAQRIASRWIPRFLVVQILVSGVVMTLAAQAAVGLWKAIPPQPNFALAGLSVVEIEWPAATTAQENVSMRWRDVWQAHRPSDKTFDVALSSGTAPFLPIVGRFGTASTGQAPVRGAFPLVTPNFFSVIGYSMPPEVLEGGAADSDAGVKPIVLSSRMAQDLFGGRPALGSLIRINNDPNKNVKLSDPVSVVRGVFDDGVIGAKGAEARFNLSQLSMQAAIPTGYTRMEHLGEGARVLAFVRHPGQATEGEIKLAVAPALDAFIPGARVESVTSAVELYKAPLRKERAMASVLGLLAIATFCLGALGMLALMQMYLTISRTEIAVRYALGALPGQAIVRVSRSLIESLALGLGISAIISAACLFLLNQSLETIARAGAWGPVLSLLLVVATASGVALYTVSKIRRANWMEWLRFE